MSGKMVDRIAAAISDFDLDEMNPDYSENLSKAARAAIEAMREPSEEMREAAHADIDGDYGYGMYEVLSAWHAMIDAALCHSLTEPLPDAQKTL